MTKRNNHARLAINSYPHGSAKLQVHSMLESELQDIRNSLAQLEEELDDVVDITEGRRPDTRAA